MDPQKEKEESLKHDRRNTYGESRGSAYKSIRRHKRLVNQVYRHKVNQVLTATDPDSAEDRVAEIRRPGWTKYADTPLGEVLLRDIKHKIYEMISRKTFKPATFDELEVLMRAEGWEEPGIRVMIRQLKAIQLNRWSAELDLDLPTARKVHALLVRMT